MFIELVDSLRCPNDHAETWLVATCDAMRGRDIVTGTLGCPICRAQYAIVDGAVANAAGPRVAVMVIAAPLVIVALTVAPRLRGDARRRSRVTEEPAPPPSL